MTIPTYQEFQRDNMQTGEAAEIAYKDLLARMIRVALDNMMLNVHQNQKECSVEQFHSLAVMFHTMSSLFVVTEKEQP